MKLYQMCATNQLNQVIRTHKIATIGLLPQKIETLGLQVAGLGQLMLHYLFIYLYWCIYGDK